MISVSVAVLTFVALVLTSSTFVGTDQGYELLPFLPLTYCVSYFIFIRKLVISNTFFLTTTFSIVIFGLVCIIGPSIYSLSGYNYQGSRYFYLNPQEIRLSILLIAYSIFFGFLSLRFSTLVFGNFKKVKVKESFLEGNKIFYLAFIFSVFICYFLIAKGTGLVSFFVVAKSTVAKHDIGVVELLLRQSLVISMAIIFLWGIHRANVYEQLNEQKRFFIVLFLGILLVGMIVGGRRSVQLFTSVLAAVFIIERFPKYKLRTLFAIFGTSAIVIVAVTLHRWFGSLDGGSASLGVEFWALYFQTYFAGPDSVATPMSFFRDVQPDNWLILFDFARSIFGLSQLLKDVSLTTSQLYNYDLYFGEQITGQLIFAPVYGYYYLGFLFSPIIIGLNVLLCALFEKLFSTSRSLEFKFLWLYCFLRVAFNLMVNTPTIITVVTLFIGTMGLLFLSSFYINRLRVRCY
ncbi:hypothetical protein AB4528_10015 [Vibrio breoganii]